MSKRKYIPIAVAYKSVRGKNYVKKFTDLNCPDKLITNRSNLLPKGCEILEIAVGERFYKLFQKKYIK